MSNIVIVLTASYEESWTDDPSAGEQHVVVELNDQELFKLPCRPAYGRVYEQGICYDAVVEWFQRVNDLIKED